ncbi:MAG: hypothetical protein M5R40_14755 [Anaerolineae bacterium]|nr:hypothetical protein [Anaerolineae bacterium]
MWRAGGGYRNVRFLVGIDGRYQSSALSYLQDDLLQRDQEAALGAGEAPSPYSPALVNQFVMFNFYGHARTSILEEGTRSVPPLPEAINLGLNLHPNRMMEAPDAYAQLRQFFADGFWMVQLHLTSIQMRKGAPDAALGQFYFEVAGYRVPPDGVFAPSSQSTYVFEHFTPLGTVAFPANKAAADVNFRLREVGRAAEKRRTLFTTLHVPLVHGDVSDHVMQDSFGSEIRLRVHCTHVPQIIPVEYGG